MRHLGGFVRDKLVSDLQVYLVGGAVRDQLLGDPVVDRDWVVVGSTPEELLKRGFKPVGQDFPVFLHPNTKEEYALARTERKNAPGYHGFTFYASPEVTLEADLQRRDITINAMAMAADGKLIDPYQGAADLQRRVLRHVSPAFTEDPVRILRLARFAALYSGREFKIHPTTVQLMLQMVQDGEVSALVPERVWQELVKALRYPHPTEFFNVLRNCRALASLMPELNVLWGTPQSAKSHPEIDTGVHTMLVLEQICLRSDDPRLRFAAICHDIGKGLTPQELLPKHTGHEQRGIPLVKRLCRRLRVPIEFSELALLATGLHGWIHCVKELGAEEILEIVLMADVFRRPERMQNLLLICEADHHGRQGYEMEPYPQRAAWQRIIRALTAIDSGKIAASFVQKKDIAVAIRQARLEAIQTCLEEETVVLS